MKRIFNHTKKPYQKWEQDDENYDWDEVDDIDEEGYDAEEDGAYYADGEYGEEGAEGEEAYFAEEEDGTYYGEEGEEAYYAEEEADEYYGEEGEEAYYAEGEADEYYGEEGEEAYYAEEEADEYYGEDGEEEMYYADDAYEDEDDEASAGRREHRKAPIFAALWNKFRDMSTMDRVVAATGVAVLVLAVVTCGVFVSARMIDKQVSEFVSVGTQLEGIDMIGEQGMLAVTDAHLARIAAANAVIEEEEEQKEYEENDYNKNVTVKLELVSVQKDLKIKFANKETDKLISNVPFTVTITDPDGKTATWSDDDMDGIIYKKGITPGNYKVAVDALSGDKYANYTLPTDTQTVEVKKEIAYKKIDVTNEIKKESEINAAKEDTKKNETVVESKLEDTVAWVESTTTANTYVEVGKNSIPDPLTLVARGAFMRMAVTSGINPGSIEDAEIGQTYTIEASYTADAGETVGTLTWSTSNPGVVSIESTEGNKVVVKAVAAGDANISYSAPVSQTISENNVDAGTISGTCTVKVKEKQVVMGTLAVDKTSATLAAGFQVSVATTATGFEAGKALKVSATSANPGVATVTVDEATGAMVIKGVAAGDTTVTVSADYKDTPSGTPATATVSVKVTAGLAMTLDKTAVTVFLSTPVTINATVANAATETAVTAESSDTGVATVAVDKKAVTITGVKAGSATITVKYVENGVEVKATCAVTVKGHPKDDKTTKLKDNKGEQLYVLENNAYREATYADYYTVSKFYVKGSVKYTGWQTLSDGKVYFFTASGEKVTGEQVIQGAKYNFASDGSLVTGSGTMGIDVSKWNGTIDWNAVKNSGVSYVIIRCGYRGSSAGALIDDPKFKSNIKGATAAGLKVGIYFFTQAVDEVEAVEEASMVLDRIKGYKISYPIFLDVEASGGRGDKIDKTTRTAVCKAFCKTIQDAGYTAGIYANKTWLNEKINTSELSAYKIWLAQYAAEPTYSGRYDLWQYTSSGKVSGISGNVDLNTSYLGY